MTKTMIDPERKNFIRIKEDFTCEHCGEKVKGTGYTNHCPNCLWSKHVDLETPGDRLNPCKGLMQPIGVEQKKGKWRIITQCVKCGETHINDVAPDDNMDLIIKLSTIPTTKRPQKGGETDA